MVTNLRELGAICISYVLAVSNPCMLTVILESNGHAGGLQHPSSYRLGRIRRRTVVCGPRRACNCTRRAVAIPCTRGKELSGLTSSTCAQFKSLTLSAQLIGYSAAYVTPSMPSACDICGWMLVYATVDEYWMLNGGWPCRWLRVNTKLAPNFAFYRILRPGD